MSHDTLNVPLFVIVCSLDCSFNGNLCGWSQAMTDAFDWTMERGSTPTLMTGPSADHTGGAGAFFIICYIIRSNDNS
jgi:hypothetical protein